MVFELINLIKFWFLNCWVLLWIGVFDEGILIWLAMQGFDLFGFNFFQVNFVLKIEFLFNFAGFNWFQDCWLTFFGVGNWTQSWHKVIGKLIRCMYIFCLVCVCVCVWVYQMYVYNFSMCVIVCVSDVCL